MTLLVRRFTRISPVILLLSIPLCYAILSTVTGFSMNRLSYMLYGDSTFTGRTIIWDFVHNEIARKPLLGWGYQSFWLAGPDAPSIVEAPGWVKDMPNAHNGYLDTKIEMGYVGYVLLLAFIGTSLHAIGDVADRDFVRAWILLSLAIHIIVTNGLESVWMRGFEMLWIVFLIVAAEIGRHRRAFSLTRALDRSKRPRPVRPGPSHAIPRPVAAATAIRPRSPM
jgi:O-antigen ligase